MANRHLSRSVVMQTLFEWDFAQKPISEVQIILKRNAEEFAPGMGDFSFMESLVDTVLKKQKDLDRIIEKAAPDWPIDRISVIDRNVLRIGLSELLFSDRSEVPPKVAINEAIELAKSFGGDTSSRFVNGVLGAVYKEMGEPGKDEVSKKKKIPTDIPDDKLPVERLAGAIIYAKEKKTIYLALVHDVFGYWTLSKGHLNEGEVPEEGVARVIKEEIGLSIIPQEKLGQTEYGTFDPEKGKIKKRVIYFLAETTFGDVKLMKEGGLDDVKWFKLADIVTLNFYNDILPLVTKAINILLAKVS
ncbi:MAG: transcription antitermination factor NusB [Patescibacteria group bacterium]